MKRITFYILIGLMVSLIVAIMCWRRSENGAVKTEPSNQAAKTPVAVSPSNTSKSPIDPEQQAGITPNMTQAEREQKWGEWYIREAAKLVPEQKPFAFYGKVVDENTQAVAGATIHLILSTTLSNDGVMDVDRLSDDQGGFSLTDKTGSSVSVSVWKNGYYTVSSRNQSELDTTGGGSAKENPTLFFLKKKGEGADLISAGLMKVKIPLDGTPVKFDLMKRSPGQSGQLWISQIKPPYESWKKATAWSFKMEISEGGFLAQNEEFPFEAPGTGYHPTVEFSFKADQPNWKTMMKTNYYIVFGSPPHYGRLTVETDISWNTAHISYVVNPDGSRYLESK